MRTRLRFAALALAGAMCFAVSARAEATDKSFGYCKMGCTAVAAGCGTLTGGDVEFCGGMLTGCIYGCGIKGM